MLQRFEFRPKREFSGCRITCKHLDEVMDFTQFETTAAGTWYVSGVVDYATKLCLAAPVSGTQTARDAVQALREAMEGAEELLGCSLLEDCIDPQTGELTPVIVVSDNGPAYKSSSFLRFIMSRPELDHVRTRHHAPETNGVVERFYRSLKYDHLYRLEISNALVLGEEVQRYLEVYNRIRPHESLGQVPPLSRYLAEHPLSSCCSALSSRSRVDIALTFVALALAYATNRVMVAFPLGLRMVRTEWPRSAWYVLFPPLAMLSIARVFSASELGMPATLGLTVASTLLYLAFIGATAAFYLRRHHQDENGAAFTTHASPSAAGKAELAEKS